MNGERKTHLDDRADRRLHIVALRLRRVEDLHGVDATRNRVQRSVVEVLLGVTYTMSRCLEATRLQRGTHHHQLQVRALRQNLLQKTHHNIGRQRALVRLIKKNDGVATQHRVAHRLALQHTVRHVLQLRALRRESSKRIV